MYNIPWVRRMENLKKFLLFGFIFDVIMVLIIVTLPHFYINTVIFSCIINIVSMVYDQVRTKKLGFVVRNEKFFDSLNNLMVFSVFFPIFNIIFSNIYFYKIVCNDDRHYIYYNRNRFIPFKQAIREYKEENIDLLSNSKKVSEINEISKE